ncbi:MAG: helix-turn-helix transcriptional regulator, partial [Microcoleus sp. SIO2G3]|nr:helix-turn-helix transcriptional regulator [Microcoleus sp. SIO2G3]
RHTPATFRMMFASPHVLESIATQICGRETGLPFFASSIVMDAELAAIALRFHIATEGSASRLEQESLLLQLLSEWILRYAELRQEARAIAPEREAVRRVREYLQDHFHENVTLDRLSQIANLSPYHLNRVFSAEVGIPPHQYQAQVRIARAKLMLMKGVPIGQVALNTGFADQSHFGRYFKRYMQVSPRRYLWQDGNRARSF